MALREFLFLSILFFFGFSLANHAPDYRCQKNSDCDDQNITMCCGFIKQKEGSGEKGFNCYDKTQLTKYNVECLQGNLTFCDYCQVGTYCCTYETMLTKDLYAWCKLNTTYMTLASQEFAPNQPLYRCLNKTTGTDYSSMAVRTKTIMLSFILGSMAFIYSF